MSAMCGVRLRTLSKSSYVRRTPASRASASRCSMPLVEPPTAFSIAIAFSNASNESMSLGRVPDSSRAAHAAPASYTALRRLESSAGGEALPGSASPTASEIDAIVLAVNMPPHDPAPGQAAFSMSRRSPAVMAPEACAPTASYTSTTVSSRPPSSPGIIVPPYTNTDGTSRRAMAIMVPGSDLSQPAMPTSASYWCALTMSSIESAMTSRETSEDFMPSWPIAIPSLTAIVENSRGVAPPSDAPRLASAARPARCTLHGVASLPVWHTPTSGRDRSASSRPMALYIALCGARSAPSRTFRLDMAGPARPPPRSPPASSCMPPPRRPVGILGFAGAAPAAARPLSAAR